MSKNFALGLLVAVAACSATCAKAADTAPGMATPSVALSRPEAAVGSPIDVTYKFVVAPDAPAFAEDYVVFVHFLDVDGELMWTDDHPPPTPTRQWKPGSTIEYARTVFVPKFPYVGETRVRMGLYSPASGQRLPLSGQADGDRSYQVGTFQMTLQKDNLFVVYKDGWQPTEVADDGRQEWQWSKKQGTVSFRNPKRDVTAMLLADLPVAAHTDPLRVDVRLGDAVVDTFTLGAQQQELRRIPLTADQLGSGDTVELVVVVDKTFIPSAVPQLNSRDGRELGVRVFRVHIEPK